MPITKIVSRLGIEPKDTSRQILLNMGKNLLGGGKSRKGARNRQNDAATQKATRYSNDASEVYACVTRLFGGPNCEVKCVDGELRLCVIRNKFRGRGKRDNTLTSGTWVLIGLRDWESRTDGKLPRCDLLEVYTSSDKQRLKNTVKDVNWGNLAGIGADPEVASDDEIDFVDQDHYQEMVSVGSNYITFGDRASSDEELDIDTI
jgi:initiation factor 1A